MSWLDRIHEASLGRERALVYLERAQGRNSKRLCEKDIEDAIAEADISGTLYVADLLERYNQPWSLAGLAEAAACFAEDLRASTRVEGLSPELFSKFGWDDGGPISQWVQACFRTHLEAWLPVDWTFAWVQTVLHNPRPSTFLSPTGEEYDAGDIEALPKALLKVIAEFEEEIPSRLQRFREAADSHLLVPPG